MKREDCKRTENNVEEKRNATNAIKPLKSLVYSILTVSSISLTVMSCRSDKIMTEALYMQYKNVKLELPPGDEIGDSFSSGGMLSEVVNYTNKENGASNEATYSTTNKLDANTVYRLNEVVVTSRSSFTPERDGRVSVNFLVRVPKELISPNWSITLSPQLLHNDSVVPLKDLIIKGEDFYSKQQSGYEAYDKYLASIVDKKDYDSVFLDKQGIAKDIYDRQSLYLGLYKSEWNDMMDYQKWKKMMESRYMTFNVKQEANRLALWHKYQREAEFLKVKNLATDKDTTGISASYNKKFEKRAGLLPQYRLKREIKEKSVPRKFKEVHAEGHTVEDIKSHSVSERDSVDISKHRYFYDKIIENEMKDSLKNYKFRELVPYEIRKDVKLDSIADTGSDFVYLYNHEYPVTAGLKKIRITMKGHARAIDESGYTFPRMDTLTYLISSIDQLIDTTLTVKKTKLYRNMYSLLTIYPKFTTGKAVFNVRHENNRMQIDTLMSTYNVFTKEKGLDMDSVVMTASTALDGSFDNNAYLSKQRVDAVKDHLRRTYGADMDIENVFKVRYIGEDWNGLVRLLQKRDDIEHKGEILHMISNATFPDACEEEIKKQYKEDYRIIRDSIYPKLHKVELAFNMSRPGMVSTDSIQSEFRSEYYEGLRLLKNRQYWEALEILANYPDYNTALCFTSMGYNDRAYNLLVQLEQTANVNYLLAIVCYRLNKKELAVEYLLKACELDNSKIYRAPRDMETKSLINTYKLKPKLDKIEADAAI